MQKKSLASSVLELRKQGYRIKFRTRSDGGIIVQSINGQRFTGAEGNRVVRELTGNVLSEARERQLASNVSEFIRGQHTKKQPIDADLKKELRKAQRLWKKAGLAEKGQGKIRAKTTRQRLKREGIESALQVLKNNQRYALGYAYAENVNLLADKVKGLSALVKGSDQASLDLLAEIADTAMYIASRADDFKENLISPIYEKVYDDNLPVKERIRLIRQILGI